MRPVLRVIPCVLLALSILLPVHALGTDQPGGKRVFLPAGETHEGWFFATGDDVVIEGTVIGDVYASGGSVRIEGRVVGDVLAAGGQVTVAGEVTDDVRTAGASVQINGLVGKNISAAGGSVLIGKNARVGGGVLLAGGDVSIAGTVHGSAFIGSGSFKLSGAVNKDVRFGGGTILVVPGSTIGGNLDVVVEDTAAASIDRSAVAGKVSLSTGEGVEPSDGSSASPWFTVLWVASLLFTALIWVLLFPSSLDAVTSSITRQPLTVLLWGIGGIIALPLLVLLLFVTLIGIPLGLALGVLGLWICYLAAVVSGAACGVAIRRGVGKTGLLLAAFFGIVIVQLLALIPFVKILIIAGILVAGIGAMLSTAYAALRPGRP